VNCWKRVGNEEVVDRHDIVADGQALEIRSRFPKHDGVTRRQEALANAAIGWIVLVGGPLRCGFTGGPDWLAMARMIVVASAVVASNVGGDRLRLRLARVGGTASRIVW